MVEKKNATSCLGRLAELGDLFSYYDFIKGSGVLKREDLTPVPLQKLLKYAQMENNPQELAETYKLLDQYGKFTQLTIDCDGQLPDTFVVPRPEWRLQVEKRWKWSEFSVEWSDRFQGLKRLLPYAVPADFDKNYITSASELKTRIQQLREAAKAKPIGDPSLKSYAEAVAAVMLFSLELTAYGKGLQYWSHIMDDSVYLAHDFSVQVVLEPDHLEKQLFLYRDVLSSYDSNVDGTIDSAELVGLMFAAQNHRYFISEMLATPSEKVVIQRFMYHLSELSRLINSTDELQKGFGYEIPGIDLDADGIADLTANDTEQISGLQDLLRIARRADSREDDDLNVTDLRELAAYYKNTLAKGKNEPLESNLKRRHDLFVACLLQVSLQLGHWDETGWTLYTAVIGSPKANAVHQHPETFADDGK